MRILLISGHGAGDNGATSAYGVEATENRVMSGLVCDRLTKYADVTLYPTNRNCYQDNKNGQLQVDFKNFDYVFEFHMNQSTEARRGLGNGTEIMVHQSIGGVSVEEAIVRNICSLGFAMRRDRGIWRTDGFLNMATCLNLGVDYALLETCFIDSERDMSLYGANKSKIADAIVAGIVEGFGLAPTIKETPNADALMLRNMTTEEFIEYVGQRATLDQQKTGILACVTVAQAMLECANGKSELACGLGASEANITKNGTAYGARNLFGMKKNLSVGTWTSTAWNGAIYNKQTAEQKKDGTYINIWSDFRSYETIDQSIADHSQYLANSRLSAGGELRYKGIVGETDYNKVLDILVKGGYATSLSYKKNLASRIEKYNLARFNCPIEQYKEWIGKVVGADSLRVRKSPNGDPLNLSFEMLPCIKVIGEVPDSDGDIWYKIDMMGLIGYVWPKYLSK